MATKSQESELQIVKVDKGVVTYHVLGTTPILLNRMSEKVLHELLLPKGKKTAAEKAGNLKHDPYAEFIASAYIDPNEKGPTMIQHLATAFKGAMASAALDVPGSSKAQIGRLVWVEGERIGIYGIPQLHMSVTRSADMNKTPDVRTRLVIPKWACKIDVSFVRPLLNEQSITNLLVSAGMTQGTGDWRTGKGKGTYGSFTIVSKDDADWNHIVKHGGRKAQAAAMANPDCYDAETAEMFAWFQSEVVKRGKHEQLGGAPKRNGRLAEVEAGV